MFNTDGGYGAGAINPATGVAYSEQELERLRKQQEEQFKKSVPANPGPGPAKREQEKKKTISEALNETVLDPSTGLPLRGAQLEDYKKNPGKYEEGAGARLNANKVYDIDVDAYSDYMDQVKPWIGTQELDLRRAQGQSGVEQAGNAAVRAIGGAIFDFVGGMASMVDIEDYYNQDDEIGNPITDKMDEWKNAMNDSFGIYREKPGEAFDVGDPAWWFENGSSLVASIGAFAAQGAVVGATLGAGAAGLTANAAKWAQKLAKGTATLATSTALNQTEAVMSASTVYKENLDHYISLGATEEEAKAKAADDASNIIAINRANIALNLTGASMFTRAGAQTLASRTLLEAPKKLFSKAGLRTLGSEGVQEFGEEQINFIAEGEGKKAIAGGGKDNILSSLADGNSMAKYADDASFWEAGTLGAIGGIGQGAGGMAYRKASGKYKQELEQFEKQEARIAEIDNMAKKSSAKNGTLSSVFLSAADLKRTAEAQKVAEKELEKAEAEGDQKKIEEAQLKVSKAAKNILWSQIQNSLQDGTTESLIGAYKHLASIPEKEAIDDRGMPSNYKERAEEAIKFIEETEDAYNKFSFAAPQLQMDAVANRANALNYKGYTKEAKENIQEVEKAMNEIRSGLSPSYASMSDEELALENDAFAFALKLKRANEKEADEKSKIQNELDSEYIQMVKKSEGKRAAKNKAKDIRQNRFERRREDAFRERIQDEIIDNGLTRDGIQSLINSVQKSNHPEKNSRLDVLYDFLEKVSKNETIALDNKRKQAQTEVLQHIDTQAEELKQELGLTTKAAQKVAEAAKKQPGKKVEAPQNKKEEAPTQNAPSAGQPSLNEILGVPTVSLTEDGKISVQETEPTATAEDLGEKIPNKTLENLSPERKANLSEGTKILLEEAKTVKEITDNLDLLGDDIDNTEAAILNERVQELQSFEQALKDKESALEQRDKELQEAGVDPDAMLDTKDIRIVQLSEKEGDNSAKYGLENTPILDLDSEVETTEEEDIEEESSAKMQPQLQAMPVDAVTTVDTQFISLQIDNPETPTSNKIEMGVREKGFFVKATDENGNPIPKLATKYVRKTEDNLTEEEKAVAIPLYWYPVKLDETTGMPIIRQGFGMDKYRYDKSSAPVPLLTKGMKGEPIYIVPADLNETPVLESEVLAFEDWVKPENANKDQVVYLKKGQYVYPQGHEKAGQEIFPDAGEHNQPITVHLTPDGPPVQKIAADSVEELSDLRTNFDVYSDESGAVPVMIHKKGKGFVINQKQPDGSSAKNPIGVLGAFGKDFTLGVGSNGTVIYTENGVEKEYEAKVEDGRVYAMVTSANGEKVPVRLETKKVSEKDADHIIDNIILNSELEGNDKAAIIKSIVGTIANHNIEDSENANGPLFFANNREIKLRVGGQILSIGFYDFGDKGINNLRQALNGERFLATVYQSSTGNPEYNYGEPLLNDDGKPKQEYFDPKSPKTLTPEMLEALQDFRQVIKDAIMSKNYDVSKKNIVSNTATIDHTTGETYNSYSEYLEGKNILTTDVTGLSTGQKFTNSKAQLIPVNKKIQIVTPSVKVTSDIDNLEVADVDKQKADIEKRKEERIKKAESKFFINNEKAYLDFLDELGGYELKAFKNKDEVVEYLKQRIDAKYKAELAALEQQDSATTTQSNEVDSIKIDKFKKPVKFKDYTINLQKGVNKSNTQYLEFQIKDKSNNLIGFATFWKDTDGVWYANNINLFNNNDKRKGIMTFIYNSLISNNIPLKPSKEQTEEGIAFWNSLTSKNESNTDGEATPANIERVSETDNVIDSDPTQNEIDNNTQKSEPEKELDGTETTNPEEDIDPNDKDFAFRKVESKFEGDPLNILTDTEISWIIDTFGEEHLAPMAQAKFILIKGEKAYGAYSNGMVFLARDGKKGTAYHEAFHLVFDLASTSKEKEVLMKAAKKVFGEINKRSQKYQDLKTTYPNKNEAELAEIYYEEEMAEAFRTFMESEESKGKIKRTKVGVAIQKFFDRIRKAILAMRIAGSQMLNRDSVYLSNAIMNKAFLNIKNGNVTFSERTKSIMDKQYFNPNDFKLRRKKGFTEEFKHDMVSTMRYALMRKVIPKMIADGRTTATSITEMITSNKYVEDVRTAINETRDILLKQGTTFLNSKNPTANKTLSGRYLEKSLQDSEWNDKFEGGIVSDPGFGSLLIDSLKLHGSNVKRQKTTDGFTEYDAKKVENEVLEFGEEVVEEGENESTSIERIHNSHFALSDPKKTLASEVKIALSFVPTPTIVDKKTGKTISNGRSKFTMLPTFIDFHKVYSMLTSKLADVDISEMEDKLQELSAWNPMIASVYTEYQNWSPELKNKFKAVMSKTQLKFMTVVSGENMEWKLIETNRTGVLKQILEGWARNKNAKNLFVEEQGQTATVNKEVLQKMADSYEVLNNEKLQENPVDYYKAVNEVFSFIGIEFDAPVLQMLATKYSPKDFNKSYVQGKFKFIMNELGYDSKTKKIKSGKGVDPYVSTQNKGQLKTITKIAELVKDVSTDLYTGSFVNGEGKMVYSINLNSYISKFKQDVSTVENIEKMWEDSYSKDVFYNPDGNLGVHSSLFFELLKNNPKMREEFDIIELDTAKDKEKGKGTSFDQMTEKQAWLTRMAMFANNGNRKSTGYSYISMGTKADKGRSLYMKVPTLQNAKAPTEMSISNGIGIKYVKEAAKHVLKRNVMQEAARIKLTYEQLFGPEALTDDQLIENLHYKREKDGTINRKAANGLKFMSIPDLNFSTYGLFNTDGSLKEISTEANYAKVNKALDAFLEREVLRGKNRMVKAGVLFEKDGIYYTDMVKVDSFGGTSVTIDGEQVNKVDDQVSEFLMNELVWRTEINKFQMGDLALYKTKTADISNDAEFNGVKGEFLSVVTDAGKRSYQTITPGIDHVIDSMYGKPKQMSMAIMKDIETSMSVDSAVNIAENLVGEDGWAKPYLTEDGMKKSTSSLSAEKKDAIKIVRMYRKGSNSADAQGYTTLKAHRHSMMSRGDWTMEGEHSHEKAYREYWKKEVPVSEWPDWVNKLALKPLKTFYWGKQYDAALQRVSFKQIKHSTVPLYAGMTKQVPSLDKLRQRMEATGEYSNMNPIDVVNMESAVKVGKSGVNTYSQDGSYLSNMTLQTIYSENERSPFILPTDKGTDPKDGSQFVKLITSNMDPGAVYDTVEGMEAMTTEQIKSVSNSVYVEKIKRASKKLREDLGYDQYLANGKSNSRENQLEFLKKVQKLLIEQIESRDLPDNYSIALEIQQLESGDYSFAMPLSFPAYAKKFEIALASLYKSRVLTQRLPGDAAVQVAEYGDDTENRLKYYSFENGDMEAAECAISYKEAEKLGILEYADENGIIDHDKMPDKSVLEIIGYRIPTQGKSSMLPLIVKRILPPTSKGQIMLPHEIVTQTGSDYDVDKMFLYYPALQNKKHSIIWGHPGLGKSTLRKNRQDVLDFDTDFKPKVAELLGLPEGKRSSVSLNKWRKEDPKNEALFEKAMKKVWGQAKKQAKKDGSTLMVSDMMFLRDFQGDFDKVITTNKNTFIKRAKERGDSVEGLESWKENIDKAVNNISKDKIVSTEKYLSDIFDSLNLKQGIQKVPFQNSLKRMVEGTKSADALSDKQIENILFATRFGILTSKHNNKEVINPLDSDTYPNKMSEYGDYNLLEKTDTFNFSSGYTDMHLEMVNKDAKALVGIFSSHSVGQAISQDVSIQTSTPVYIKTVDRDGKEVGTKANKADNLSEMYGFDGVLRSIYTNENQNASLDNAKEPITGSLNINTFTANVVAYLNRLGYNNDIAVDLINQPIIRELTNANNLSADGSYITALAAEVSERFDLPKKGKTGKEMSYGAADAIIITPENLKAVLKSQKSLDEMSEDELMYQKQILLDFVQYHQAGTDLAKTNKMMSPDRFTQMSGLVDIEIWKNNKTYVEEGRGAITVNNLYTEESAVPRIKAYYEEAILGAENIISEFMPYNSKVFTTIKNSIAYSTHQKDGYIGDKDLLNKINSDIFSYVMFGKDSPVQKYMMKDSDQDVIKRKLFDMKRSTAKQIDILKKKYNLQNNTFLSMVSSDNFNSRNTLQMLKFNNAASYSGETKSSFVDAFEELVYYPEKVLKSSYPKFNSLSAVEKQKAVDALSLNMRRIIQYGIVTSGFQNGPNTFIDLFPVRLWKDLTLNEDGQALGSLSKYISDQLAAFDNVANEHLTAYSVDASKSDDALGTISGQYNMVDQIIRNRFEADKLLKSVSLKANKLNVTKEAESITGKKKFPHTFEVSSENASNLFNIQRKSGDLVAAEMKSPAGFPYYIKMWDTENKKWRLYKRQSQRVNAINGYAEYQVISPLGEEHKFFEVYPTKEYPESIHPDNNDFKVVEPKKTTPKKSKETADDSLFEDEYNPEQQVPDIDLEQYSGSADVSLDNMSEPSSMNILIPKSEGDLVQKKIDDGDVGMNCAIKK